MMIKINIQIYFLRRLGLNDSLEGQSLTLGFDCKHKLR